MLSGNKGEWSEIYTLLKLLGDSGVHSGDSNLNKIESILYPIIKIIRQNNDELNEYIIDDSNIKIILNGTKTLNFSKVKFLNESYNLLNKIKSSSGSFSFPDLEIFLHSIEICILSMLV
jgi:type II restriction enzyme